MAPAIVAIAKTLEVTKSVPIEGILSNVIPRWFGRSWHFFVWRCLNMDAWTALPVFFCGPLTGHSKLHNRTMSEIRLA